MGANEKFADIEQEIKMGRKRNAKGQTRPDELEFPVRLLLDEHRECIETKMQKILDVLVVQNLSTAHDIEQWELGEYCYEIKRYEIFPYYLLKAILDEDFRAIQWGEHEDGETILINYDLIRKYLDNVTFCPPQYGDDFDPIHRRDDQALNRLHYNLEIFGFNEIDRWNLDRFANEFFDLNHPKDHPFVEKLEKICEEEKLEEGLNHWIEYHHSDFFAKDNPPETAREANKIWQPKKKNSKFFKLCQTLKTEYRVRTTMEQKRKQLKIRRDMVPVEEEPEEEPLYGKSAHFADIPSGSGTMPQWEMPSYSYRNPYSITRLPNEMFSGNLEDVEAHPVFDVDQESLRARTEDTSDMNDSQLGQWGSQFGDSQNGSGIGAN